MEQGIIVVRYQGLELRVRADELDRYPGAERVSSAPGAAAEQSGDSSSKQRDEPANKRRDETPNKGR